jgi:hypothetical protein
MKSKRILVAVIIALLLLGGAAVALAAGNDLATIKRATARYRQVDVAIANGYEAFMDCFSDPVAGGMGFHYVNFDIVDLSLDPRAPEALVFEPQPNGGLRLVSVEYIVPAEPWDSAGNTAPPTLLGQMFHLNEGLGVYVLHAWVWEKNPSGVFADYNPNVSC